MKALVGAFIQEKALVGAFSVIVNRGCRTDGALHSTIFCMFRGVRGAVHDNSEEPVAAADLDDPLPEQEGRLR